MAFKPNELQAIAASLRATLDGRQLQHRPFTFCVVYPKYTNQNEQIFWTASPVDGTQAPSSSVVRLLQFMAGWNGLDADRRYHCHFHTSSDYVVTQMCRGMASFLKFTMTLDPRVTPVQGPFPTGSGGGVVQVTEVTQDLLGRAELDDFWISGAGPAPVGVELLPALTPFGNQAQKQSTLHRLYMMATFALVAGRPQRKREEGHNIGALLVSGQGQILGWGLNQRNLNNSFHAEVNTLQSYWKRTQNDVPAGAVLFTTLKPCKMCAGMIAHTGVQRVYMGQDDPGTHARNTALDGLTPKRLFFLGEGSTKPVKVFTTNHYNVQEPQKGLKVPNLTTSLQTLHGQSSNPQITKTLNESKSWWSEVTLTSRSLLRKVHKYSGQDGRNATVFSALWHIAPFVDAYGNNEYKTLFQQFNAQRQQSQGTTTFGQMHDASSLHPLAVEGMDLVEDEPSNSNALQVPQPLTTSSPVSRQQPLNEPFSFSSDSGISVSPLHPGNVSSMHTILRDRLFWELNYSVGPLFEQRLGSQHGKFEVLRERLRQLIWDTVERDVSTQMPNPWQYHEHVVALLLKCGDAFCRELDV